MESEDFFSSKQLEELIVNRKESIDGKEIAWKRFQSIALDRNNPFVMRIKEYCPNDSEFISVSLQNEDSNAQLPETNLTHLFEGCREISLEKFNDLKSVLKYIPQEYHDFYNSIKHSNIANAKDYGLASRQSSIEE